LLASFGLTHWLIAAHATGVLEVIQLGVFLMLATVGNLLLFAHEWMELLKGFTARRRGAPASTNKGIEVA
jgi:hypothetical protein